MLKVTETFMSYQGEGPNTGKKTFFIRLAGCNMACKWCDTKYSWNTEDATIVTGNSLVASIEDLIDAEGINNVCITGGEPLLQQLDMGFIRLIQAVHSKGINIEIETNGTVFPEQTTIMFVDNFNISPKLQSAGAVDPVGADLLKSIDAKIYLESQGRVNVAYKYVVDYHKIDECLAEIEQINEICDFPDDNIWLMPLGTKRGTILANTGLLMATPHPYNVSSRSHIVFDQK